MERKSIVNAEYSKVVSDNPDKKFIMYLRSHPEDEKEHIQKNELASIYGECKELTEERLAIFIVVGNKVNEFIDKLNSYDTQMYLSFIQIEDELIK